MVSQIYNLLLIILLNIKIYLLKNYMILYEFFVFYENVNRKEMNKIFKNRFVY